MNKKSEQILTLISAIAIVLTYGLASARAIADSGAPVKSGRDGVLQPVPLPERVYIVPNYHPASCGWLADLVLTSETIAPTTTSNTWTG